MGVEILSRSTKFYNQFINGETFGDLPLDFTTNLTGSVMDNIKLVQQIEIGWFSKSKDSGSTWTVDTVAGTLSTSSGNFITDGFAVGDTFIYEDIAAGGGANFTAKIDSISSNFIAFTLLSGSRTNVDTDAIMRGTTDLSASVYKFGLIDNNANFSITSLVSNNDQGYYGSAIGARAGVGLPRDTSFIDLQRLGSYEDWRTGSAKVRFVSDNYNPSNAQIGSQIFEIKPLRIPDTIFTIQSVM